MSLFKYKPPKKIVLDERSITTLDSKHKELQSDFQYIQDTIIPGLENERNMLKERLNLLKGVPPPRDGNFVLLVAPGGAPGVTRGGGTSCALICSPESTGEARGGAAQGPAAGGDRQVVGSGQEAQIRAGLQQEREFHFRGGAR